MYWNAFKITEEFPFSSDHSRDMIGSEDLSMISLIIILPLWEFLANTAQKEAFLFHTWLSLDNSKVILLI